MADAILGCRDQRVTLVEIILDTCANTFGESPCTASGEPCFNTWNTCKDQCNFTCQTTSYWFTTCKVPSHLSTAYTPNIVKVDSNPTTLEIGKSFSTRGRIKVTFQDDAHNDLGFDPYWPRGAIPICPSDKPGTLFGRWIERVKYFENRRANVYHGYCDQPLCDFVKESYFIDSVSGPSDSGKVDFVLKDPLILADDKNAQCPRSYPKIVSTQAAGNEFALPFTLGVALDGVDEDPDDDETALPYAQVNKFLLQNNYLLGNPDQDACFTRLRHICIGREVMEVKAVINNATPQGWNIQLLDRGVCGSAIGPHEKGASISFSETFENAHVADVVLRMLTECSELKDIAVSCCDSDAAQLIDFDSFEEYRCSAPLNYVCESIICKPIGLTTLLNELSDQFLFFLYSDSSTGKIVIKNLQPPDCGQIVPVISESQVVKGSFSVKNTDDRYNQITYRHDIIDCSKKIDDENLASSTVVIRADSLREPCDRREFKTRKIKEMKSRWINQCNKYMANANGERWLFLRDCPAHQVTLDVLLETGNCFDMGGFAKIHHSKLQSVNGEYINTYWLLKGKSVVDGCMRLTFERTAFDANMAPCLSCVDPCSTIADVLDDCEPQDCVGVW